MDHLYSLLEKMKKDGTESLMKKNLAVLLTIMTILYTFYGRADLLIYASNNGVSIFFDGEKYGYITDKGQEITNQRYDRVEPFLNHTAIVELNGKKGIINEEGFVIRAINCDEIYRSVNNQMFFCVIDDKWGVFDEKGRMVWDYLFDEIRGFVDGYAIVVLNGLYGLIDDSGNQILECLWEYLNYPMNGWCLALTKDYQYTFVNLTGEIMNNALYEYAEPFIDGYASVIDQEGDFFFINTLGERIQLLGWEAIKTRTKEGLVCVCKNNAWGYVDMGNHQIIDCIWDDVSPFSDGLAKVQKGDKYGFIDYNGNVVCDLMWDEADDFFNGYAIVVRNNLEGLIDNKGCIIISPEWQSVGYPSENIVAIENADGKIGFYDICKMSMITEFIYDSRFALFECGIAEVFLYDNTVDPIWINDKGEIVCP